MPGYTRETIKDIIGTEVGVSDWVPVTQDMINQFADLTNDHQYIHVNPELAKKTPFGTTIAHGFLTLSMVGGLAYVADIGMAGVTMGFNYGFNKVRFLAPVKNGSRIRGRFFLKSMEEREPNQWLSTLEITIEIEDEDKPALIAEWLGLSIVGQN
ncbi:MAG: MaoC family dehydratase [Pseudomonadota bacterium]